MTEIHYNILWSPATGRAHGPGLGACVVFVLLALLPFAAGANPLGITLMRNHPPAYIPGELLEVTIEIHAEANDALLALGMEEELPEGWEYVSVSGAADAPPPIHPEPGAGPQLEFAWIIPPSLPYAFAYTVYVPETASGPALISGGVSYRLAGGPFAAPWVVTELNGPNQTAPTLTLLGNNPMRMVWRGVWKEPGYTALDQNNMDITARVVVSGAVDVNTPGNYTLKYSVSSEDGAPTARAERVVEVVAPPASGAPPPVPPDDLGPEALPAAPSSSAPGISAANRPQRRPARPNIPAKPASETVQEAGRPGMTSALPDLSAYRPVSREEAKDAPITGSEALPRGPAANGPGETKAPDKTEDNQQKESSVLDNPPTISRASNAPLPDNGNAAPLAASHDDNTGPQARSTMTVEHTASSSVKPPRPQPRPFPMLYLAGITALAVGMALATALAGWIAYRPGKPTGPRRSPR